MGNQDSRKEGRKEDVAGRDHLLPDVITSVSSTIGNEPRAAYISSRQRRVYVWLPIPTPRIPAPHTLHTGFPVHLRHPTARDHASPLPGPGPVATARTVNPRMVKTSWKPSNVNPCSSDSSMDTIRTSSKTLSTTSASVPTLSWRP